MDSAVPVILFAYTSIDLLMRTLDCLRADQVPLIYAFSDGPKTPADTENVNRVRQILRKIDWCDLHLVERDQNYGLGKSIMDGVTQILEKHETAIIFEDDLVCVPGTYKYLCAALERYKDDKSVMSVTGWAHPLTTPSDVVDQPYFDGRTECYVWGTWRRAWEGMDRDALSLMEECERRGIDIYRYGADLVKMAKMEKIKNLWAVRFSYLHILNQGLCLRPPYSIVKHLGIGEESANVKSFAGYKWYVDLPRACPPIPEVWPSARENLECPVLWQKECGIRPKQTAAPIDGKYFRWFMDVKLFFKKIIKTLRRK